MLDKKDAIKTIHSRESNSKVCIYYFKCKNPDCQHILHIQSGYMKYATGYCTGCAVRKRPFEAMFNIFLKQIKRRGFATDLIYDDFLKFMEIKTCHYCHAEVARHPYTRRKGKVDRNGHNYKLDRKNNELGYLKDNLVVCCWRCNNAKGSKFTYEEWYGMTEYLRKKKDV